VEISWAAGSLKKRREMGKEKMRKEKGASPEVISLCGERGKSSCLPSIP